MADASPLPSAMPGTLPPPPMRYAGFWIRFGGRIIDSLIMGAITFALIRGTGAISVTCPADTVDVTVNCPGGVTTVSPLVWIVAVAAALYYPILWGLGGTLGHRALGLRVVGADSGTPIGIPRGFLRLLGYIIAEIPIMIGLIWAAFDPRKQGWHDKIASSVVIHK